MHDRAKERCRECRDAGVPNCGTIYCKHDKVKSICVECGGSQICEHKKRRQQCRLCSGAAFCEHGKWKSCCRECGPKSFCEHGKQKHNCIECGTAKKCEHGNNKYKCKECVTSSICPHGLQKYNCNECQGICLHGKIKRICKECDGKSLCIHKKSKPSCRVCRDNGVPLCGTAYCVHDRAKMRCRECRNAGVPNCGTIYCEHDKVKSICKECKGSQICKHGIRSQYCKSCGGNSLCKSAWCSTLASRPIYKGYCRYCFLHLFPDEPVTRNYKTKEREVVNYIKSRFSQVDWTHDKVVMDGCSRKRPDLLCDLGSHVIIVEVDENQHATYESICENKRLMILSQDLGHRPMVMVRFNPDGYENESGEKIPSPWRTTKNGNLQVGKKHEDKWKARLVTLGDTVQLWMEQCTEKMVECIELYYSALNETK